MTFLGSFQPLEFFLERPSLYDNSVMFEQSINHSLFFQAKIFSWVGAILEIMYIGLKKTGAIIIK